MGSIHKRLLKDGSARWQAMVTVNGKQMGKRFKRKKDAEDWISRLKVDVNDGTYRELKKASFGQYIELWKKTHLIEARYKPSTLMTHRCVLESRILPEFRYFPMTAISSAEINRFMAKVLKEGKTVGNILGLLNKICKDAIADGYLRHSPMEGVRKPKDSKKRMGKTMTPEQIRAVLEIAEDISTDPRELPNVKKATSRIRLLFLVAVLTGMRRGELLGLQWPDVDFTNDLIHVRRALFFRRGKYFEEASRGPTFVEPKSEKSKREIDLSPTLKRELLGLSISRGKPQDGLVFCTAEGKPLDPDNVIGRNFYSLLQKVGLGKWEEIKDGDRIRRNFRSDFRWHDLRHTFGSLKLDQGANIYYVQRQMGHSSIQVTVDIYGHLLENRKPEEAAKTDRLVFGQG